MNKADYHPDWDWISRQIRDQADHKCEFCDAPNGQMIYRNDRGEWRLEADLDTSNSTEAEWWLGDVEYPVSVRVVLTVAHLCHDRMCIDPTHLRALCQRCHLNYDRAQNANKSAVTRLKTRTAKILATGQEALL